MSVDIKLILKGGKDKNVSVIYTHDPNKRLAWNFITRALMAGGSDIEARVLDLSENMTLEMFNLMYLWQRANNMSSEEILATTRKYGIVDKTNMVAEKTTICLRGEAAYVCWCRDYPSMAIIDEPFNKTVIDSYLFYQRLYDLPALPMMFVKKFFGLLGANLCAGWDAKYEIMGEEDFADHIMSWQTDYLLFVTRADEVQIEKMLHDVCFCRNTTPRKTNKVFDALMYICVKEIDSDIRITLRGNHTKWPMEAVKKLRAFNSVLTTMDIGCTLRKVISKYEKLVEFFM